MTTTPARPLLPLLSDGPHGSRSAMTCQYKCGNACDHPIPNTSNNPEFRSVIEGAIQRRSVLRGAAIGAGALAVGGLATVPAAARPAASLATAATGGWTPVEPNVRDIVSVPEGYRPGRDRVGRPDPRGRAPAFDPAATRPPRRRPGSSATTTTTSTSSRPTAPAPARCSCATTSTPTRNIMFPPGSDPETVIRTVWAAHGMSVVELDPPPPR